MIQLYISDEMFDAMKHYCSDKLISEGLHQVSIQTSKINIWDITSFVYSRERLLGIIDKLNIVLSFMECGGSIEYKKSKYTFSTRSYLMTELIKDRIISYGQDEEILIPWIDCTNGEPFFEIQGK